MYLNDGPATKKLMRWNDRQLFANIGSLDAKIWNQQVVQQAPQVWLASNLLQKWYDQYYNYQGTLSVPATDSNCMRGQESTG